MLTWLLQIPGLDIDYQDKDYGYTAAHCAVGDSERRSPDCVEILADRVDWSKKDWFGQTPLDMALRAYLYQGRHLDEEEEEDEDALEEIVEILGWTSTCESWNNFWLVAEEL